MPDWPPLVDHALQERLALDQPAFESMLAGFLDLLPARPDEAESMYRQAIAYPWDRPTGSFVFDGERAQPLAAGAVADFLEGDVGPRFPLLAIGSNGAASTLARKLAHLPEQHRRLIAFAGRVDDLDIGPAAMVTVYGAVPATPFVSPGAAVHASVLWVTAEQLTALTWTEVSYFLGRLSPVRFVADDAGVEVDHVLLYASRFGSLTIDDAPIALAALPAAGRTARALTQVELLDHVARLAIGVGSDGVDLVRHLAASPAETLAACRDALRGGAAPFAPDAWAAYPASPAT
jgi:hypothetical protein